MKNTTQVLPSAAVAIRVEQPEDAALVARLAALDSSAVPASPVLIGTADGRAVAAISLVDGHVVADPFEPTAALVALLRLRADHLHGPARGPDRRRMLLGRGRAALALRGRRAAV